MLPGPQSSAVSAAASVAPDWRQLASQLLLSAAVPASPEPLQPYVDAPGGPRLAEQQQSWSPQTPAQEQAAAVAASLAGASWCWSDVLSCRAQRSQLNQLGCLRAGQVQSAAAGAAPLPVLLRAGNPAATLEAAGREALLRLAADASGCSCSHSSRLAPGAEAAGSRRCGALVLRLCMLPCRPAGSDAPAVWATAALAALAAASFRAGSDSGCSLLLPTLPSTLAVLLPWPIPPTASRSSCRCTTCTATWRHTAARQRPRERTPASLVYPSMMVRTAPAGWGSEEGRITGWEGMCNWTQQAAPHAAGQRCGAQTATKQASTQANTQPLQFPAPRTRREHELALVQAVLGQQAGDEVALRNVDLQAGGGGGKQHQ